MTTVYLAGPDVFLSSAINIGLAKKKLCADYQCEGLFPLDAELAQEHSRHLSTRIFDANMSALLRCDAVIANLTPFRGVSADIGTVFEVAYAIAIHKPVFAYTNVGSNLLEKVATSIGLREHIDVDDRAFANDGMVVENFGLIDNLMIVEAIRRQGWDIISRSAASDAVWSDLSAFEECLRLMRQRLAGATTPLGART